MIPARARFRRPGVGRLTLGAVLLVAVGCSGSGTAPPDTTSVTIRPSQRLLVTEDTLQLTATAGGATIGSGDVSWSSSDPAIATVDDGGRLIAHEPGSVTITGAHAGATGTAYIAVTGASGPRVPELAGFDSIIPLVMAEWDIPGGAVGVVKDGRLILARGYGWADEEAGIIAGPDHLFRVASVSKPLTAVAVLDLVEDGLLDLDAAAFELVADLEPAEDATEDPRLADITVRQLLHHAGGWNRDATFDPMFRPIIAAEAVGAAAPASAETVIRYMRGQPLQFDPGQGYAYSNFGYAVLGRIIERVTGASYEDHVRSEILAPLGISTMRIGSSLEAGRADNEAAYYDNAVAPSVFSPDQSVPIADGGFHLEAMDAHGGWIASAVDLLRLLTAVDARPGRPDILEAATLEAMVAPPPAPLWTGSSYYYAMGWLVRPTGGDANWWHDGSLPGTSALLVRAHSGMAWVALFNARAGNQGGSFGGDLDQAMWQAIETVDTWPSHDLFDAFD